MTPVNLVSVLVGLALLFLGRRLFWLFVAAIGFLAGAKFGAQWMPEASSLLVLALAVLGGVIGALLAIFLQKLAAAFAGFLGGGFLAQLIAVSFGMEPSSWLFFIVGGAVGALLMVALLDWGLIALSVMVGAAVVADSLGLQSPLAGITFIVLAIVGAIVQAKGFVSSQHRAAERIA